MSSSKVFRQDPHFTPTTLVRRNLTSPPKETKATAVEAVSPPPESPNPQATQPDPPDVASPRIEPDPASTVDLEALRQEAYEQGMADLAARFQEELEPVVAAFAEGCRKIDNQRIALLQQNRSDLINLIILLCEKILGQELLTPRNVIATTLQSALEQAIESEEYYVTLHPEDLAVAEARVPELIAGIRGLSRIVFKTDDTMTRGGCMLESGVCTVDASIETQLESMKEFVAEQPLFAPIPETNEVPPPVGTVDEPSPAT